MDNASLTRQQMIELLIKLNETSVKHCNLVNMLQSMEDDLGKSVTQFHTLLDEIEKLATTDGDVLSLVEIKGVFSAIEAFKLSFVYYRSFESNKDRLCSMIFNMEKLKFHPLSSSNTNTSNCRGSEMLEKPVEPHCSKSHNSYLPGSATTVPAELQEPTRTSGNSKNSDIGSSIASALHTVFERTNEVEYMGEQPSCSVNVPSLSQSSYHCLDASPASQKIDDCISASQSSSSSISVGCNLQVESSLAHEHFSGEYFSHVGDLGVDFVLPMREEVITTDEMEYSPDQPTFVSEADNDDSPKKTSTDAGLNATPTSSKKRVLRHEHLENALGFGCARDMPFSKEFIEKAKGNHFLKKFISVRPSNSNKNMRMKISPQSAPSRKTSADTKPSSQELPADWTSTAHTHVSCDPKSPLPSHTRDCHDVPNENGSSKTFGDLENGQGTLVTSLVGQSATLSEEVKAQPPETPVLCHVAEQQNENAASDKDISDDEIKIVYERKAPQPRSPMNVADVPLPPAKRQKIDNWSNVTNVQPNLLSAFMGKMLPFTFPYQFLNPNSFTKWARLLNANTGANGFMMNPSTSNQNQANANYPGGSGAILYTNPNNSNVTPEAPTNQSTFHTTGLHIENQANGTAIPIDPFSSSQQSRQEHPHS